MILIAWIAGALAVAGGPKWDDWSAVERCNDVVLEYRLSADPWAERIEFRLTNRSGEKLAAAADIDVRWSDGDTSQHVSCILGGIGGPLSAADTSVPEAWAAPGRSATKSWDRSASSPDPQTGSRPAIASFVVERIWVTTEARWKRQVAAHPGAMQSLRDGPGCEGREIKIGWRRVARSWRGESGAKDSFEQRIELRDGVFASREVVRIAGDPEEVVRATIPRDSMEGVRIACATPYEMPFGKVVFVEVRFGGGGACAISSGEDSDPQDRLLLHFYELADAQACVEALEDWKRGDA